MKNTMKMKFEISKAILCRYAEVVSKIAGDKIDVEKEVWNKEMTTEKEVGPFAIKSYENFYAVDNDGSIDRVIHAEVGIKDDYIYDLVDVLEKHGDNLEKIVTGVISIMQGFRAFLSGMEKDMRNLAKKYKVEDNREEDKEMAAG